MSNTVKQPLRSLTINGTHRFCTCWEIERRDGVILRFTDFNRDLVFEGNTYKAMAGLTMSARQHVEGLDPKNFETKGVLTDDTITEDDLRIGKYRNADVTEIGVNWMYPWLPALWRNTYIIQQTSGDQEVWQANMAGMQIRLTQSVGFVATKTCRWKRFGDTDCGVNLASITITSSVSAIVTQRRSFETPLTQANNFFNFGSLAFTSGANNGVTMEVKKHLNASGLITFQVDTPLNITVGDTFSLHPGCNRLFVTCRDRYTNGSNFGGYRHMRGSDASRAVPPRTS